MYKLINNKKCENPPLINVFWENKYEGIDGLKNE